MHGDDDDENVMINIDCISNVKCCSYFQHVTCVCSGGKPVCDLPLRRWWYSRGTSSLPGHPVEFPGWNKNAICIFSKCKLSKMAGKSGVSDEKSFFW